MFKLGEEQEQALEAIKDFILNSEDIYFTLSGSAGSGKTLLIGEIIKFLQWHRKKYILAAPTHKAKTVIEYYTDEKAITLHSLLALSPTLDILNLSYDNLLFNQGDAGRVMPYNGVVICDEASMISDDLYHLLEDTLKDNHSKCIFVMDSAQLQPVKSEQLSLTTQVKNQFHLTKIYRQDSKNGLTDILQTLREHSINRLSNSIGDTGSLIVEPDFVKFFDTCLSETKRGISKSNIFETKILAYTNNRVNKYNEYIAKKLFSDIVKFNKTEILNATENFSFNNNSYWNSSDYIVTSNPKQTDINIKGFMRLPGYTISLFDGERNNYVEILDNDLPQEYLDSLGEYIENLRLRAIRNRKPENKGKLWGIYFNTFNSFLTPKPLYFNNRLIKKQSLTRGYAMTVHRSQGSSFNNICVDWSDINICRDPNVLRQLQYVALSRTRNNAYVYQK